jgi:hypothetical protein
LHYLALGVGLSGASQVNARILDRVYIYFQKRNGGVGRPEFRLREFCHMYFSCAKDICCGLASMVPGTICLPLGLLITGWAVEKHVFWLVPDIVSQHYLLLRGRQIFKTGSRVSL